MALERALRVFTIIALLFWAPDF